MKTCPKCLRTYEDSVLFCPRDGMPLAGDSGQAEAPLPAAPASGPSPAGNGNSEPAASPTSAEPSSALGGRKLRSPELVRTGLIARQAFADAGAGPATSTVPLAGAATPGSRVGMPVQFNPVGKSKDAAPITAFRRAPTTDSAQLPPWEQVQVNPTAFRPQQSSPKVEVAAPAAPAEEAVEAVITPDLPEPAPEREAAAPVGDETVLELDDPGNELELEPEAPPPPVEPEIPLEVRKAWRCAIPRAATRLTDLAPPVDDDGSDVPRRYLILAEEGAELAGGEEEPDVELVLINPFAKPTPPAKSAPKSAARAVVPVDAPAVDEPEAPAPGGNNALLYGMMVVVVVGLLATGYFLFGGGRSSDNKPNAPSSTSAQEPAAPQNGASPGAQNGGEQGSAVPSASGAAQPTAAVASAPAATPAPAPATPAPMAAPATVQPPATASAPAVAPAAAPTAAAPANSKVSLTVERSSQPPAQTAAPKPTPAPVAPPVAKATPKPEPAKTEAVKPTPAPRTPAKTTPEKASEPAEKASSAAPVRVVVVSNEIGAEVYVDGALRGKVPTSLMLPPGSYNIKVQPSEKPASERRVTVVESTAPQREMFPF